MHRKQSLSGSYATIILVMLIGSAISLAQGLSEEKSEPAYQQLREAFAKPNHAVWGEVPLWWWEGDRMDKDRVTWQLQTLADQGVKSVCPIQRSPGRCDPQSFSPEWWEMFVYVHDECKRLGMTLWAYDQVGYGHYGWLEKAAAQAGDDSTKRIQFVKADGDASKPIELTLPDGELLAARAYPIISDRFEDTDSIDITDSVSSKSLKWKPASGKWRVTAIVAVDDIAFQLSKKAGDTFIDMFYGEIERRVGKEAMGESLTGIFQDEHPPTPRDIFTEELADTFRQRCGYEITRAIPALHFDVGPLTPKYRTDFFDTYLSVDERCYWKNIYDWIAERNLLTSHDNWGRQNIDRQSQGYIDYFRTQRWFSAPGYDDAGTGGVTKRNYYDTKIAASIARLYNRPRVWSEAFHSSGWGRTTDQTLSWLSANYAFGANQYDEHGLYYSTRASTWEHAAPDPHWRQPYWHYYGTLSDWVARASHLMSQGESVVDVAVHYPVVSLLAGEMPGAELPDYNYYMQISRRLFDDALDNDIIDDDSILSATVKDGELVTGSNRYQALVFGPETTMRREVLQQAITLAESGGTIIFVGGLPKNTTEGGRRDPQLATILQQLLRISPDEIDFDLGFQRNTPRGGLVAIMPDKLDQLPNILNAQLERDFATTSNNVFVAHRHVDDVDVYLVQNTADTATELRAVCRVDGVPEIWDAFTGMVSPLKRFERQKKHTTIQHTLEGNVAQFIVFRPGSQQKGVNPTGLLQPRRLQIPLRDDWEFSVIATRDNRWGEFRWPPSDDVIGPEIRSFRYAEASLQSDADMGWHKPDFDDTTWSLARYSVGPYWLCLEGLAKNVELPSSSLIETADIQRGGTVSWAGDSAVWEPVEFSKTIGLANPAPWGGHSGYPDGAIDQNFVHLPEGRKILFTRIRSPKQQRLGLRVELRNSSARLWVNGVEQPFEEALGNLPLKKGENTVFLDLPDGGHGMLYAQRNPPKVSSLAEATTTNFAPDLKDAFWIRGSDPAEAYVRKTFELDNLPDDARIVVTAYTGYRLFINGKKIHEEIGPWAKWKYPESFHVANHLRKGKNVIAAWIQAYHGQNVHGDPEMKGLACVLKMRGASGKEMVLASDGSWQASDVEVSGWEALDFDDSAWNQSKKLGKMGAEPWGAELLSNVGVATEPYRALSVDLPSPYLTCFDDTPEIVYDIKPQRAQRIGWFRFNAPPGLSKLSLHTKAPAQAWIDGKEVPVQDGVVNVPDPPVSLSTVAIRLEMHPGAYGGAAFPLPPSVELKGGKIKTGLWAEAGLPTYSGIGVYRQAFEVTAKQADRHTILDLGQVLVAAEVILNGRSVGVRLARPFKFDLTDLIQKGTNQLEVRVANTIAPHYTVTNKAMNLGPTDSGLIGPVTLRQELPLDEWKKWADSQVMRMRKHLNSRTNEFEHEQKDWEKQPGWKPLELMMQPRPNVERPSQLLTSIGNRNQPVGPVESVTDLTAISGVRLEWFVDEKANGGTKANIPASLPRDISIIARRASGEPIQGRFIRVEIPNQSEFLHMAEVQVFSDDNNNIARAGKAIQSSTANGAVASRAIDGNTNGSWSSNSVTHTGNEANPWWEVDLNTSQKLDRIVIFNRTDGELENRLSNFRVTVFDNDHQVVCQREIAEPPDPKCVIGLGTSQVAFARPRMNWKKTRVSRSGEGVLVRYVAVLQTKRPFGFPEGTRLLLSLKYAGDARPTEPKAVRLSVTTADPPLVDIPPEISHIRKIARGKRTTQQARTLAKFYRTIAPKLDPIRARLRTFSSQLESVNSESAP